MQMTVQQWLHHSLGDEPHKPYFEVGPWGGDIICGMARYDYEAKTFRVWKGHDYAFTYDMHADRILSGAGFLDYLFHTHRKEWCTPQHIKDILDCVTCWVHRDHGCNPQVFFDVTFGMNKGLDDPGLLGEDQQP